MSPAEWADACREYGLDYVATTDHNVISQNYFLARDAGADVLLMPGEEMTNWFHGHATVSGIDVGDWLDFRQSPSFLPLAGPHFTRINEFIATAEQMGAYVSAAHPLGAHLSWQFQAEAARDPKRRTHGYEVWTGPWQVDDEACLHAWDTMLCAGLGTWTGGTVYGGRGDLVTVRTRVRGGGGKRLFVVSNGLPTRIVTLRSDDQTVETQVPIGRDGGYVCAHVRGERVHPDPNPLKSEGDMEAIVDPIWFETGDVPSGYTAEAVPVPARVGPRRTA